MVEHESIVDDTDRWEYPNLTVVTDYSFGGMSVINSTKTVYWEPDPDYATQVNYNLKTPCILDVRPPLDPDIDIAPGSSLTTFRVFELVHDSTDRERCAYCTVHLDGHPKCQVFRRPAQCICTDR